jgi:hypothetical protein
VGIIIRAKMKIRLSFFLFLVLAFTVSPEQTQAQFWKKWFNKDEPRREIKKPKTIEKPKAPEPPKKKRKAYDYPASRIKDRYRIDVLVPLYLDELVKNEKPTFKGKIPEKASTGVAFYEGVKLAADTLKSMGYKIDVYVHDITLPGFSPDALVKGNILAESDLVIGALPSNQLTVVADYAKKSAINFISTLSPSDADIKNNPYFTMVQPTLRTHCERLKAALAAKYPDRNVLLFYRTKNSVDSLAYSYVADGESSFKKVLCNTPIQKQQIQKSLDSTRTNVILMPIVDNNYAESILVQLHQLFPNHQFEVYGMPSWKAMSGLKKPDVYPNVAVLFTSPFYYDITTPTGQVLVNNYAKQFGGRPAEMVFRGYETLYWYGYLLKRYGTIFNNKVSDNGSTTFTRFEIKPQYNAQQDLLYNENEHIYIYRYQGGSFFVEQ